MDINQFVSSLKQQNQKLRQDTKPDYFAGPHQHRFRWHREEKRRMKDYRQVDNNLDKLTQSMPNAKHYLAQHHIYNKQGITKVAYRRLANLHHAPQTDAIKLARHKCSRFVFNIHCEKPFYNRNTNHMEDTHRKYYQYSPKSGHIHALTGSELLTLAKSRQRQIASHQVHHIHVTPITHHSHTFHTFHTFSKQTSSRYTHSYRHAQFNPQSRLVQRAQFKRQSNNIHR